MIKRYRKISVPTYKYDQKSFYSLTQTKISIHLRCKAKTNLEKLRKVVQMEKWENRKDSQDTRGKNKETRFYDKAIVERKKGAYERKGEERIDIRYYGGKSIAGTILSILLINNTPSFCTFPYLDNMNRGNETTHSSFLSNISIDRSRKLIFPIANIY